LLKIQKNKPKIGGHLPAGEGLRHVALAARALHYDHVQMMIGGNTDWQPYAITEALAEEYKNMMYGLYTYVHLPFVINPCVEAGRKRSFTKIAMRKYNATAEALGVKAFVLHPGFKKELPFEEAYKNALLFMQEVLKDPNQIRILLETDAGSNNGSAIGSIEFIESLIHELRDERVGICVDTTHMYARGTNLWEKPVRDRFLEEHSERIELIHFNIPDPDVELGSFRDRHNSPISSFRHNSDELIEVMGGNWPLVLERRSLSVQKEDSTKIRQVLKIGEFALEG